MTSTTVPGQVSGVELFAEPPSRRPFSAGDVVRLLIGVALVVVGGVVATLAEATVEGLESDLVRSLGRLPDGFAQLTLRIAQLATSLLPTAILVVLLVRRRWRVALLLIVTGAAASVVMGVADAVVLDLELSALLAEEPGSPEATYPSSQVLASTVAVVTVAAPWLNRRWKRTVWAGVAVLAFLRLLSVSEPAVDIVLALGVGTVVGSAVLLLFGSPTNEPSPFELLDALRATGFDPRRIERVDARDGATGYRFLDSSGDELDITLRTPDERDADLLDRLYRSLRFRASEVDAAYADLKRRIEHEALVLTLAGRNGVRAPEPLRIGTTERGSAFLVTRGQQTREITADDLRDESFLIETWRQLDRLHGAGLAHRRLALEALEADRTGNPWLVDFDDAQTAPAGRELARDVAQLLTETALVVGAERAVDAAVEALGPQHVAPALRMLQPLALSPSTRSRARAASGLLEDVRDEVNRATGEPDLELEELERIKPRTLVVLAASTLAFYSLLPQLANLEATLDAFGDARPSWILATVLASVLTYVFAALSLQGAVADPVPFAPNVRAQAAASFAGLVGPAGAGGFALTGRFLQRVGVSPAEAGASVAVNALAGFAVHLTLLGAFVVWSGESGIGGFSFPESTTVLFVLAIAFAIVGVVAAMAPVRRRLLSPAWSSIRTGIGQLARVLRSPGRVLALLGGSAGISITYVVAVAASVEAFGGGLGFAQIGAAYLAAVALASLSPTPGGLGALETAMIAALTGFGLDDGVAVSATLTFRLATFWLPILPGWFALSWMQRNGEV